MAVRQHGPGYNEVHLVVSNTRRRTFSVWFGASLHKSYRVLHKLTTGFYKLHYLIHGDREGFGYEKKIRIKIKY